MDPSLVDGNFTAFEVYDMLSSQNDLSIDPSAAHLQPGTSAEPATPMIPYRMYPLDSSPNTYMSTSSSSGPPASSPDQLDRLEADDVDHFFAYLPPEEEDREREGVAQMLMSNAMKQMTDEKIEITPHAPMYPTPPHQNEISPRPATTALYHPDPAAGSSYRPFHHTDMTSPSQPRRPKRARPSSPGTSYGDSIQMQPLLPPQTPSSFDLRLSPIFVPHEEPSWMPLYDERQQQMNPLLLFIHADRGLTYIDRQEAYVNYRKTHLQLTVNIDCLDCDSGLTPKFVWLNSFSPIKEFQIQTHGVRHHNPTQAIPMNQSGKDRKMYPAVFEGFTIAESPTVHIARRLHFSRATENNNQINGGPNPKQEFFDLVVRLVAVTHDGKQHIVQSHVAHKIICRAQNPRTFPDHEDDRSIKEEVEDEEEVQQPSSQCWECGKHVISTTAQVVVGGHEPVDGFALTVKGDMFVGAIRSFCDERCKNIYKERVDEDLKEAYDQLKQLKIFEFSYKEEFAARMGLDPRRRVGLMAQQVRGIIPEAVVETGDFLSVDQAEIFIRSVQALKHLSSMAEEMQGNLQETMKQVGYILETVNRKRQTRSMASGLEAVSRRSSVSTYTAEGRREKRKTSAPAPAVQSSPLQDIFCGSRLSQCTIITVVVALVFVMAACLVSMTFLYFVDLTSRYGHNPVPTVFSRKTSPPENMVVPVNQLAHLQQNVSILSPKCSESHCHQYCCDKETIGNATAYMLRENVIVPWRDDEEPVHHFGPLPDISILIPELNITLDKSFCVSQSCNRIRQQYKLFIPLSPSFPKAPLRVQFRLNPAKTVQLCGRVDGFHQKKCMGSVNLEKRLVVRQIDHTTFELPVGAYLQSGYKFHVSYSPEECEPTFHFDEGEDAPRTTEEYNLIFYRKCF